MTKPRRSDGNDEWASAELPERDTAAICATLSPLPEPLKQSAVEHVGAILFSWRDDLRGAEDPTASEAATWFVETGRKAESLRLHLATAPAALREALHAAIGLRGAEASDALRGIEAGLARLETYATDAAAVADAGRARAEDHSRRKRGHRQRLCDAIFDLYGNLHRRAPGTLGDVGWSRTGTLPHFFNACMSIASRHDPSLKDYVARPDNALAAFQAGKIAFDDWRRRQRKNRPPAAL